MSAVDVSAEQPSSLKVYWRLLGYVRPYIGLFLLSILGFLIFASTQPMLAYILKYLSMACPILRPACFRPMITFPTCHCCRRCRY